MIESPILNKITDKKTGTELSINITAPDDINYSGLEILFRKTNVSVWSRFSVVSPPALGVTSDIDLSGLEEGRIYEIIVVATGNDECSLPSISKKCRPTSGQGPVSAQVEDALVQTISQITTDNGYFDTIGSVDVWRFDKDVTDENQLFAILINQSTDQEKNGAHGRDLLSLATMNVLVIIARNGRDNTKEWMRIKAHEMMAAIQEAVLSDTTLGGIAQDIEISKQSLVPQEELKVADAVAVTAFDIKYRTLRANPYIKF